MKDSMFIGLDVHKATISVAVADGERGGEVRDWASSPIDRIVSAGLRSNWPPTGSNCISATRRAPVAMAFTVT